MPALPKYESRLGAEANRRIIDQPRVSSQSGIGDAVGKLGEAVGEINARIEKSKVDSELVTATRTAREKIEKAKFDLENNREVAEDDIEPLLRQYGDKVISETSEQISSTNARRLWTENAKNLQSEADLWARKTARARSVDKVRAGHVTAISDLEQKAGDISLSMEAYEKNLQDQRGSILRDKDRGIIDEEHAATLQAGIDKLAVKDSTIRWQSNIDALVKQGRVAEAEAMYGAGGDRIDPDVRASVRKGLDETKQDFAVVEKTDEIWTKTNGDYAKFVKETAKIENAQLRIKVEERGDRMRLMADRSEEVRQDALAAQMWKHVESGGKIMNAPPAVRAQIEPERLGSIRAFENARDEQATLSPQAKAAKEAQSKQFRLQIETMVPARLVGGYAAWSAGAKQKYNSLTPEDMRAVDASVIKARETGQSAAEQNTAYTVLKSTLDRAHPEWNIGTQKQDPQADKVLGKLFGFAQEAVVTSKPLAGEDARRAVARALYETNADKFPLPLEDKFFNLTREALKERVKSGEIDPDMLADVEDLFYRQHGRTATPFEAYSTYKDFESGRYD